MNFLNISAVDHQWKEGNPSIEIHEATLYVSDTFGYRFTPVLDKVSAHNNYFDVDQFLSLEGVYIANILQYKSPNATIKYPSSMEQKTVITFDQGREWKQIPKPEFDFSGNDYNCSNLRKGRTCTLNLFGSTTGINYFGQLSTERGAVGLIMATGNVGGK